MTPEHKQIVQNTWEQIAPIADTAAELFYGRLFELDPMLGSCLRQPTWRRKARS
jgi:hypothetical protein